MNITDFFDELKSLPSIRPIVAEKIKSHNLPVIILGAGDGARNITNF